MDSVDKIIHGDCEQILKEFPDKYLWIGGLNIRSD